MDVSSLLSSGGLNLSTLGVASLTLLVTLWAKKYVAEYIAFKRRCRQMDKLKLPPEEACHWLHGHLEQMSDSHKFNQWLTEMTAKYRRPFTIHFGQFPVVMCNTPESIRTVTNSDAAKLITSYWGTYRILTPWLGDGLVTSNGPYWFRQRRLLTPAFHFDVLKPYLAIYNECTDILLEKLENLCSGGQTTDVFPPVSLCTLDIILRAAFSYTENVQEKGEQDEYVSSVLKMAKLTLERFLNPWLLASDKLYFLTAAGRDMTHTCDHAHRVAYDLIEKRRDALTRDPHAAEKRHRDFLDILLTARDTDGSGLTDREIRQEVDTFLFAGHDTTTTAISFALYSLALHPEEQRRCQEEVDSLLADRDTDHIQWDDLNNLPYLTLCIKESMRLHSTVPAISRQLVSALQIGGVTLPPDTPVWLGIFQLHHNPVVWGEDCEEFKPERFLANNCKNRDSHAYVPFSAGNRNCIGQVFALNEVKTVLARILKRFNLEVQPGHTPIYWVELVMRSHNGIRLKLTPRKL